MKKLSLIDKFLLIVNLILTIVLLTSFLSYYISPNSIPFIAVLSLFQPVLIVLNVIFIIFWILKFNRFFLISTLGLLLGFQYVSAFYSFKEKVVMLENDVKIMSYNVRMFNLYKWIVEDNVDQKIFDFINKKDPDILCIQENHSSKRIGFKFPYKFIKVSNIGNHTGLAIYSKFKIINSGSLNFLKSTNNAIFVDILKNNDTVRIYNIHLESLKINPKEEKITQENSEKLKIRLEKAFKIQANQSTLILEHQNKINHKSIICGDFNNTAFSWVYKNLKEGKNDAFEKAGKGFGETYVFPFPFRIDFILTDKKMEVNNFKTYDVKYSDHYPIMARVRF